MFIFKKGDIRKSIAMLLVALSIISGFGIIAPQPVSAFTSTDTDNAINAFLNTFYDSTNHNFYNDTTRTGDFLYTWQRAEVVEVLEDAYYSTQDSSLKSTLSTDISSIINTYTSNPSFTHNWYQKINATDDMMWMVLANIRAYNITGNTTFLTDAKNNFMGVWNNYYDSTLGGGIWWDKTHASKNACNNGPAIIAGCLIHDALGANDTGSPTYLSMAESIYSWEKSKLYNNGQIYDHINNDVNKTIDMGASTYNQGTFIGAACKLSIENNCDPNYLNDAKQTADYTENTANKLTDGNGILREESSDNDSSGFKGILARYMKYLIVDCGQYQYLPWMQLNANTVWNNRRTTDNLTYKYWGMPCVNETLTAFACSTGVSVLQNTPKGGTQKTLSKLIDDSDTSVTFYGSWTHTPDSNSFNNTRSYTSSPGAYAQFTFTGTDVKWYGLKDPSFGMADVYVDTDPPVTVDLYTANAGYRRPIYEKSGLSNSSHTIKIVWNNTKNPNSKGYTIDLDGFLVSTSDLGGWWKFDDPNGSTSAADSSGNNRMGTPHDSISWTTSSEGYQCLDFDGSTDYVTTPYILDPNKTDFTATAWIKSDDATNNRIIMSQVSGAGTGRTWLFTQNGLLNSNLGINGSTTLSSDSNYPMQTGTWYNVAVTKSGPPTAQTVKLYINGVERASGTRNVESATGNMVIGVNNQLNSNYFDGRIDDVRIYNRALSPTDISNIYSEGQKSAPKALWKFNETSGLTAADSSGSGYNGTASDASNWATVDTFKCLNFDGSTDYVTAPYVLNPNSDDLTASAWIKVDRVTGNNVILCQKDVSGTGRGWLAVQDGYLTSNFQGVLLSSITSLNTGTWYHVAVTKSGSTVTLYINGIPNGSGSRTPESTTGGMVIGAGKDCVTSLFDGSIDDVRIYSKSLSETDIVGMYSAGHD